MFRRQLALVLAVLCAAPAAGQPAPPADGDDLEAGVRLVEEGEFEAGIVVLDDAVQKLSGAEHRGARARAYLHLGIAYLGMAQVEAAKARFRAALGEAGDLTLSTSEFPPKVVDLFEQARHELATASPTGPFADVAVGSRVRVHRSDTGPLRGTLLSIDRAALILSDENGAPIRVARDSITRLDLNVGTTRQTLKGLLIGAGVGVAVAISPIDPNDCGLSSVNYCSRSDAIGTGLIVAGLGALVGWGFRSDRWAPVTLDVSGTAWSPMGSPGLRAAVRVRF
jgi:hypothetical protein